MLMAANMQGALSCPWPCYVNRPLACALANQSLLALISCRPPVVEAARQAWQQEYAELAPRAELVAGSFFEAVPPADVS